MHACYLSSPFFLKMKQKILKYFFFSERLCSQACYFLFIFLLISFPVWRKHIAALQTASVAADDRLMKRVQSLPRWMVLHMQQKALGDVRGGFNEPAVTPTHAQSYMATLRREGRATREGQESLIQHERNMILDNCKHSGATWSGCWKHRHISLTPAPLMIAHTL